MPAAGELQPLQPGGGGVPGVAASAELLRLAAAAHMNTDVQRAVFCCIMGAEDANDAFERLLRLSLKVLQAVDCAWEPSCGGQMLARHSC